ncbi:lysyl oxidase family protein [Micromonospora sp. DR5-3]|uniref:lysyl oxidase family protein n=1 Tax=unclassified Micromonospora TaxID=2617518 RepID=UPI001652A790|nr:MULTISPECIES: lysyl oxidase family protein [unclassified Micromonospora]MCW3814554.1 lysyl oxidase family protein [Micromonospora sp. DR5-3]
MAKSTAGVGTAQSVIIPSARNGSYDVYVSYGVTFGAVDPDPVIAYQGLAEVEYKPAVQPVRDLLPDLKSLPQENVTYDNPGTIFGDTAEPGQSCFDSERSEQGARQCLRFDQVLQNAGTGPVELHYSRESGVFQDEDVWQRIYRSDSTWQDVSAGQVEFHPIHGHYHFKGFAQSELWLADTTGKVVGSAPAAVADKVSFCIADTDLIGWGTKGDAALSYPAPACLDPKSTSGGRDYFDMGMSPGWADRYNWYLPDQMIDTYGLADGTYVLFTTVDPDGKLSESDEGNNCSSVIVELAGLATSQPQAQLRGVGPACP